MNNTEKRAALEGAFEKRGMPTNKSWADVELDARLRALLACAAPGLPVERQKVILRSLRRSGVAEARRELDQVAKAAEKLADAIETLHHQAVEALAKAGVLNVNAELCLRAHRAFAAKARAAKTLVKAEGGMEHPHDLRPQYVAGIVASAYEQIWSRNADLPSQTPGLEKLIEDVFEILGLRNFAGRRPNPRAALRAALKKRAELPSEKMAS